MSILSKLTRHDGNHDLTDVELELLLNIIKQSNFSGEMLDILYTLTLKLQRQHQHQQLKAKK
jgi:hypothetical protein|tara:strand:+ start:327 stop:512 length:186 start_codon:yes stop_codon:yes gene_type:complete